MSDISVTVKQARQILGKYFPDGDQFTITKFEEMENTSYSYSQTVKTFVIAVQETSDEYHLLVSSPAQDLPSTYQSNSLPVISKLVSLIQNKSSIPVPAAVLDTSLDILPNHFIVLTLPSPSSETVTLYSARKSGILSDKDLARVELQLGAYLGQLHAIQNDWFGVPTLNQPQDPSYSWQESFTLLFETLLNDLTTTEPTKLPYEDIRRYLSRAIGYYLFDDVEVPSLISFPISEHDILLHVPASGNPSSVSDICVVLPNFSWVLWGDPLLETFFMPPGLTSAILEGYLGAGGSPPIVFPRQKTKRLWYTLFLALLILTKHKTPLDSNKGDSMQKWAMDIIEQCVKDLKDAPYY